MSKKLFVGLVCVALALPAAAMRPVEGRRLPGERGPAGPDLGVFPRVERASIEASTGLPSWLQGDLGRLPRGERVTAARVYLERVGGVFGLGGEDGFEPVRVLRDELGLTHIRLRQTHAGLPVDGAEVILHVGPDGRVRIINGHLGGRIEQPPVPEITADEALAAFRRAMAATSVQVTAGPDLAYYTRAGEGVFLAWRAEVQWSDGEGTYLERVYVDATDGTVLDRQGLIWAAKYRKIYTANHGTTLPGTLLITEGGSSSDAAAQAAYTNLGYTYDYFWTRFGRDSYDGAGASLVATVHYSSNYNNAFWNGSQMVFGDGDGTTFSNFAGALDVVAHELSHAVTERTANLVYSNESGALNEAMSDIFGASTEAYVAGGITANTWKIGEDCYTPNTPGDALRYMNNPTADGQSYDYYPERYTGTADNGGVHLNSGIANLAYYLLVNGGTHPRNKTTINVTGIGMAKAEQIFYRALSVYMTSSTNFEGARNATAQAAADLYGSAEVSSVHDAWSAVGVPGAPVSVTPLANGQTVSNLSAATGSWQYYKISVPSGQTSLEIKIWGGTGDADLYVKRGAQPTTTSYDYRPYLSGNNETVTVSNPAAGTWYIGIRGYSSYSGVSLRATYTGGTGGGGGGGVTVLTNGQTLSSLSGAQGSESFYKITVPSGQSSLEIKIWGGTGDADLYVKYGAQPTTTSYDYRPYLSGNNETVTVSNPASGDWYIMIRGYSSYSGLSLKATHVAAAGSMTETEYNGSMSSADVISSSPMTVTAYISSSSDVDYFRVTLPAGATITVDMAVPAGKDYDIKLYNSAGTRLAYGYNGTGQAEHVTYTNTGSSAMYVYIKCYPYSGSSTTTPYTLDVSW